MITAAELTTPDYEWLNERFDKIKPVFEQTKGQNVFTYFLDGFLNCCNNFHLAITLKIDKQNSTACIYCKSYQTQDKTVVVEYDYEKAIEIEKVFFQDIPEIVNIKREINIDGGWENYIMFSSGDVISWHCSIYDEWKMYRDCIKELYDRVNEQYPMTYGKNFYTKYESRLYSTGSGSNFFTLVMNKAKPYLVHSWSKCYDENKKQPVLKLHYGRKMLVLYLSLEERDNLECDLHDKHLVKLTDYRIEAIELSRSDYMEEFV
ncbi:MAG: hypothetical protein IJF18_02100 [Oscillospiraceae bacterium]|nr:hypothetical protein [Oscillospiraceae bacterium]